MILSKMSQLLSVKKKLIIQLKDKGSTEADAEAETGSSEEL